MQCDERNGDDRPFPSGTEAWVLHSALYGRRGRHNFCQPLSTSEPHRGYPVPSQRSRLSHEGW